MNFTETYSDPALIPPEIELISRYLPTEFHVAER